CSKLSSINIPDGITTIKSSTFYNCEALTTITLPSSVNSIGDCAFSYCDNLSSINIPDGVTNIGGQAFYYCPKISSINIPNGITIIKQGTFCGCYALTSITLPSSVTSIGNGAFSNCFNLSSINIPDGVTTIGESAFGSCRKLSSINIPNGITTIKDHTFYDCEALTSITLPSSVISIGNYAFESCNNLASINIPDGVTSIGENAFRYCSGLTSITIPTGVTTIGSYAFEGCSGFTSITIPAGVTTIGSYAFNGMTYIYCEDETPSTVGTNIVSNNGIIFVPDNVVDAYRSAWSSYSDIIVGNSNRNFTAVTLNALPDVSALAEKVGESNLRGIVKLKISGSINSYDMMIIRNKMINLRELDLENANIIANDYQYYQGYSSQNNVFGGSFLRDTKIMSVVLPTTATSIGDYAFYQCSNLRSVSNMDGITSIGNSAFRSCSNLDGLPSMNNLERIGNYAFQDCSKLTSIDLPNSLTYIGYSAFQSCGNLESITIPENVTTIYYGTFSNCGKLTSIHLSPQTTSIFSSGNRTGAFKSCSSLTEFRLPPYLQSIGDYTFQECDNLKEIYAYMVDIPTINTNTFNDYKHQILYVPQFLYKRYYYDTNWSQFLEVRVCELKPGDYTYFYTNSDVVFEDGERIDQDTPDVEIGEQGGIIVEGDDPQIFDDVEQNVDGEGTGGSIIGVDDNIIVNKLKLKLQVKASRWIGFNFPYDVTIADCEYPGQYVWIEYDGEARANGNSGWKMVEGTKLLANKGYMFMSSKNGKLIVTFDHPSFGDDKPHPLQSYASGNAANAGWNFLGNPYSSYYALDESDYSSPITIWNYSTQSYEAYRPGDDDIHLQPYQPFFVQKPEHVYIVNFNENHQETYTQSQQTQANQAKTRKVAGIKPERLLINLTISDNETTVDKTRLVLNEKASRDYELECDAAKFISDQANAQLYLLENGVQMAIDERPTKGDICLGYMAKQAGKLRIEATRMDMPLALVDTKTGTTFDLSLGDYEFETEAGTFDKRFMLRLSEEATAIKSLTAKTGVAIGLQDGGLSFGGAEGKSISIYNANGVLMTQQSGNGFVNLPSGLYLVKVDEMSAKIYVK
ncbi:MAG: leucine-rich repeat domain-containing protein, partial [Bacteroidaceae bacterium]|nr:leucine-rich repeat domain-containing protein [Bacteroidaceae bacterium]